MSAIVRLAIETKPADGSAMVIAIAHLAIETKVADAIAIVAIEFIPIGLAVSAAGIQIRTMDVVVPVCALKTKMVTFTVDFTSPHLIAHESPPGHARPCSWPRRPRSSDSRAKSGVRPSQQMP